MKTKSKCDICKKDARRIDERSGKRLKEVGLEISENKDYKEKSIVLCESCRDRIDNHYDY